MKRILLTLGLAVAFVTPALAEDGYVLTTLIDGATIAANATTGVTNVSKQISLRSKSDVLVFEIAAVAAAAGTSNVIATIETSLDGITWGGSTFTMTNANTGTTATLTRYAPATTNYLNLRYLRPKTVATTQTNAVTYTLRVGQWYSK